MNQEDGIRPSHTELAEQAEPGGDGAHPPA